MFERYGFQVMNRAEITKYRAFYPESVYLSTVIKNLETAEPLSAYANPIGVTDLSQGRGTLS